MINSSLFKVVRGALIKTAIDDVLDLIGSNKNKILDSCLLVISKAKRDKDYISKLNDIF